MPDFTFPKERYFDEKSLNKLEVIPFHEMSIRLLRLLLKKKGVYDQVIQKDNGKTFGWDDTMVQTLANHVADGERTISLTSTNRITGEAGEFLQTNIETAMALITCIPPGGSEMVLQQYVQIDEEKLDDMGQTIPESLVVGEVQKKYGLSSVSGKMNIRDNESPQACLDREVLEETHMPSNMYTKEADNRPAETKLEYSGGFPGLISENKIHRSTLQLSPEAYKEEYREEPIVKDDLINKKRVTKRNIARWITREEFNKLDVKHEWA